MGCDDEEEEGGDEEEEEDGDGGFHSFQTDITGTRADL
jgi:hypothetical protein